MPYLLDLGGAQLSGAATNVNLGLLAGQSGETASNSTNSGEGNNYLLATINVGVQHTDDVLELVLLENSDG